jgi:hypothetical protein
MSDTPKTDGIEFKAQIGMMPPYDTVPAEFARRLKRERDEARRELSGMPETPETDGIEFKAQIGMMPPYDTVPAEFARRLERERDAALAKLSGKIEMGTVCVASKAFIDGIEKERDDAREGERFNASVAAKSISRASSAEIERDNAISRFEALKEFCETELHWMYFRSEFLDSKAGSTSQTIENARALQAYLKELK